MRLFWGCCKNDNMLNRGKLGYILYERMILLINTGDEFVEERFAKNYNMVQCRKTPKFNSIYSTISKCEW